MIGLQTTRVVVVDDDFSEVEPLLRGLAKLHIGALYFNGDAKELPEHPLPGVRLVFLDLHLISLTGGHGVLANTIGVLSHLIRPQKGEVGIICWTKHPEDQSELESLMKERMPDFEPAFVLPLPKSKFLPRLDEAFPRLIAKVDAIFAETEKQAEMSEEGGGAAVPPTIPLSKVRGEIIDALQAHNDDDPDLRDADIHGLLTSIEDIFQNNLASNIIWEWEQAVHNAASSTTSLLHEISTLRKEGQPREESLMTVAASLAIAAGGNSMSKPAEAARNLFEGINPIHADYLDQLATATDNTASRYLALFDAIQAGPKLTPTQKAQTNSAILTANITDGATRFQPGNLYIADATKPDGCPHALCKIEKFELGYGMLKPAMDKDCQEIIKRIDGRKKLALSEEEVDKLKSELISRQDALLEKLLEQCLAGVLEVTPACDFANKKYTPARFVGCLAVPSEIEDRIVDGDFIRRIKPLTLHSKDGVWILLLNSRFMFGVSNPVNQIKTAPITRLRLPLLIDVQAWLAAQGARPGYVAI